MKKPTRSQTFSTTVVEEEKYFDLNCLVGKRNGDFAISCAVVFPTFGYMFALLITKKLSFVLGRFT